jgi:hypothetical protein
MCCAVPNISLATAVQLLADRVTMMFVDNAHSAVEDGIYGLVVREA